MGVKQSGGGGKKKKRKEDHQRPKQHEEMKNPAATNSSIDLEVLDCTICMDPLQPPVFQCAVGHVLCSSCHDSLPNKDTCHTCKITGGYNRCIALDKILESFCVPCSNAEYGCTAKMRYHEAEKHGESCPHAPCFCPEPGCGFVGSTIIFLAHLTDNHKCPSTELKYNVKLTLHVDEGMHVLHSRDGGPLFMVKFTPTPPVGNAVSVLCVDPHAAATTKTRRKFRCHLGSSCLDMDWQQSSCFQVRSTTLSDGFPPAEDGSSLYVAASTSSITVTITKILRDDRGNEIQLMTRRRMMQSVLPFTPASSA